MKHVVALALALSVLSCTDSPVAPIGHVTETDTGDGHVTVTNGSGQSATFNIRRYTLNRLVTPALAYTNFPKGNLAGDAQDSIGVPVVVVNGVNQYHPVFASWRGIQFLDSYNRFHEQPYLDRAELIAVELTKRAARLRGGLYFPYTFNYAVLTLESETMKAPWYSGMAQGRMLSLFVRLFEVTGKPIYKAWADSTFTTFTNYPDGVAGSPWTVFVDKDGFYWVEEYPHPSGGNMVANGHAFGIYGLYDYWLLTGNSTAKTLAQAAITTTNQYAPVIRNPGAGSLYEVKHKVIAPVYHLVNIQNLTYLTTVTGDAGLAAWRDLYMQDKSVAGSFTAW